MGGEEGTSGAGLTYERILGEGKNRCSAGFANGDGIGEVSSSGASEIVRTYKRRKKVAGLSSDSVYERDSLKRPANKPVERTVEEPESSPCNHVSENSSTIDSNQQSRTFILRLMYHLLKNDDSGIKRCIKDALVIAESDSYNRQGYKPSSPTACKLKGSTFDTNSIAMCNGGLVTESSTMTERCQHAFLNIIMSENFTRLCKLFEKFQGTEAGNLFGLSLIDRRMTEGAYEKMPLLFSSDIQQLCKELQQIGADLVSLSKSLQDVSTVCFDEQIGGLTHCSLKGVKHEFSYQKSDCHDKPEQTEARVVNKVLACRRCEGPADPRDCLVCDSCEEIYHVFCIEPAISDIPPSWYCVSCTASGFGTESPHENCVLCEKMCASRVQLKRTQGTGLPTDEDNFNDLEETSSYSMCNRYEQMPGSSGPACKLCEIEVEDDDKIKICEHDSCPYKYFHVRCLTKKQLKSHGPRWYCPSCLCRTCFTDKDDNKIILCDSCDNAYHIYCLTPPRSSIPQGKWFCSQCQLKLQVIHKAKKAYKELDLRRKSE